MCLPTIYLQDHQRPQRPDPHQTRLLDRVSKLGSSSGDVPSHLCGLFFARHHTGCCSAAELNIAPCIAVSATGGPAHFSHAWEDHTRKPLWPKSPPAGRLAYIRGLPCGRSKIRPWSPNGVAYIPPAPAKPAWGKGGGPLPAWGLPAWGASFARPALPELVSEEGPPFLQGARRGVVAGSPQPKP